MSSTSGKYDKRIVRFLLAEQEYRKNFPMFYLYQIFGTTQQGVARYKKNNKEEK